jgi:hypothetical protein
VIKWAREQPFSLLGLETLVVAQPGSLPSSNQSLVKFHGKSVFRVQRHTGHNVRRGRVRGSRDQVYRAGRRQYWVSGAAPGNLRRAATDWWSNEDSNQGPAKWVCGSCAANTWC